MRRLVVANWKMNMRRADGDALARSVASGAGDATSDIVVCPPFPLVPIVAAATAASPVGLGAQDCHPAAAGAHTGDVSAELLADLGCGFVIVGHSERRADHGESDALVKAKAAAAAAAGMVPIVCVGETEADRDAGRAETVVAAQLHGSLPDGEAAARCVVAYEPVWAIGTGRTPTADDIAAMHGMLRRETTAATGSDGLHLLYGGSVKPANAAEILAVADVDGALVGGASLKGEDFLEIACAP